ncbi:nitroreductase family protein [Acuticoccus sp. I52.16.1]|uniref:nitroreductase family protein n=1 Tax=Acuticoccus sp. I52.16.1 TaxID=2928472 RepID=UPI001FD1F161|nr:nitroreductase family protein [Acuticoccus sp. I52.16.1]UOM33079.1 nitroreductase family protein [Acuticoccus sp. I52.16.1]
MDQMADTDTQKGLLAERYGERALPAQVAALPDALLSHRSVRAYTDRPLPEGALEAMVAAAQSASTSSNLQTWSVVAVEDQARRDALAECAANQAHIRVAPLQLVWLADLRRLRDTAARHRIIAEGTDYLELFLVAALDAAIAAQNAALAAEAMGLGIVYIGAMRNKPLEVARILDLPERTFAVFGMCVGYPDAQKPASIKPRLPQSAVLHRETYDLDAAAPAVAAYDIESARFYKGQGMERNAWSMHVGRRVAGPASLSGRHALREQLVAMGFPLK